MCGVIIEYYLIGSGVTSTAFDMNVALLFLLLVWLMFIATSSVLVLGS